MNPYISMQRLCLPVPPLAHVLCAALRWGGIRLDVTPVPFETMHNSGLICPRLLLTASHGSEALWNITFEALGAPSIYIYRRRAASAAWEQGEERVSRVTCGAAA